MCEEYRLLKEGVVVIEGNRISARQSAFKDIALKGSKTILTGVCWEYYPRYSEYTQEKRR